MMHMLGLMAALALCQDPAEQAADDALLKGRGAGGAWDDFPVFLWFVNDGPDPDATTLKRLRDMGIDATNIEAPDQSSTHALLGVKFYVGHLAGKGELKLREEVYQAEVDRFLDARESHRPERPVGLMDEEVLERLEDRVQVGVNRHRYSRPLAYSLGDEPSVTNGLNPIDFSFDERTLTQFRAWLKNKYSGLEELNATWESSFASLEDVVPETTDEARHRNAGRTLEETNFASWNDHRRFMDSQFTGLVGRLVKEVGRLDPGVPVGILGGQAPGAFGGYDWYQLARAGTFFEAYEHGSAPTLVRSFSGPETRIVSTLFLDEAGRRDDAVARDLWRRAARGDDGAVIWASDRVFRGESLELSQAGEALVTEIQEARRLATIARNAGPPRTEVLVYVSQASVRAAWMLSSWADGATWHKRYTSYENDHGLSIRSREGWEALLGEMGLPWRALDSRELLATGGAELPVKVMILNEGIALSDAEVRELLRFVASGGLLIGDAHAALFDEHLVGRDERALQALFGVLRLPAGPFDGLAEWVGGQSEQQEASRFFGLRRGEKKLFPANEEVEVLDLGWLRKVGAGRSLYLNLDMSNYRVTADKQPQVAEQMRVHLAELMAEAGTRLFPHVDYGEDAGLVRLHRYGEPLSVVVLVHERLPMLGRTVPVRFEGDSRVYDLNEGISLGTLSQIEVRVPGDRAKVLRLREVKDASSPTRPPAPQQGGKRRRGGR